MAGTRTSGVAAGTMDGGVRRGLTVPDKGWQDDGPCRREAWPATVARAHAGYRAPPPPVVVSSENGSGARPSANSCSSIRWPMNIAGSP